MPQKPKIKPSARITQLDEGLYSISLPDSEHECQFNDTGYLVVEELEPGKFSFQEIIQNIKNKYGILIQEAQLTELIQKLAHIDLLEHPLHDYGIEPGSFAEDEALEFLPETEYSAKKEIKELLKQAMAKKSILTSLDRQAWMKILFGVLIFIFPWPDRATGPAEIQPFNDMEVRASVSGQITGIFVNEGDKVKKGTLLVQLGGYQSMIERKKAEINKLQAEQDILTRGATKEEVNEVKKQLDLSKQIERQAFQKYQQYKDLSAKGLVSTQEYESILSEWKIATKEREGVLAKYLLIESGTRPEKIQAKQAEIKALSLDLEALESMDLSSKIYAPMDGVIATPDLQKLIGKVISPGDAILKISNNKKTTILTEISEKELGKIDLGEQLTFKIQALPNKTFRTKVSRISPIVEKSKFSDQHVVRVYADMDNPNEHILPGMTGSASITLGWNSIGVLLFYDTFLAIRMFLVI